MSGGRLIAGVGAGWNVKLRRGLLFGGDVASSASEAASDSAVELTATAAFTRRGAETKLVLPGLAPRKQSSRCDPALIKAIARGRAWFEELISGHVRSLQELAKRDGISRRYIRRLIGLAFLSPELIEAILQGRARRSTSLLVKWFGNPNSLQRRFVELALDLCRAGSAGISMVEEGEHGQPLFRWTALEEALVEAGIAGPLVAPVDLAARAYRDGVPRFPIGRCEGTLYGARSRRLLDQLASGLRVCGNARRVSMMNRAIDLDR